MGAEEDQETPFQEMDAHQLAEKNSLGEGFYSVRRASEAARLRISSLCLMPEMTVEAAVDRDLSTRGPKPN